MAELEFVGTIKDDDNVVAASESTDSDDEVGNESVYQVCKEKMTFRSWQ